MKEIGTTSVAFNIQFIYIMYFSNWHLNCQKLNCQYDLHIEKRHNKKNKKTGHLLAKLFRVNFFFDWLFYLQNILVS